MPNASRMSSVDAGANLHRNSAGLRSALALFALAFLFGMNVAVVRAQTYLQSIGSPTFSTQIPIENGYIDASNGRLHLAISMGSFAERGVHQDNVALIYDSNSWTPGYYAHWGSSGGWQLAASEYTGVVNYTYGASTNICGSDGGPLYNYYKNWTWTAPDGTVKSFPTVLTQAQDPNCNRGEDKPNSSGWSSDGTGFFLSVTGYYTYVVTGPDGSVVASVSLTIAPKDSNGEVVPPLVET